MSPAVTSQLTVCTCAEGENARRNRKAREKKQEEPLTTSVTYTLVGLTHGHFDNGNMTLPIGGEGAGHSVTNVFKLGTSPNL